MLVNDLIQSDIGKKFKVVALNAPLSNAHIAEIKIVCGNNFDIFKEEFIFDEIRPYFRGHRWLFSVNGTSGIIHIGELTTIKLISPQSSSNNSGDGIKKESCVWDNDEIYWN